MKHITSPHNNYFETMLAKKPIAIDFLKHYLPKTIKANFDSLRLEKDTFVDQRLRQLRCDTLFSLELEKDPERFYVLIEHQSTPDRWMPLRIYDYIGAILQMHRKIHNDKYLPLVYPLILFHGQEEWAHPIRLTDLITPTIRHLLIQDAPLPLPLAPIPLIDLQRTDDEILNTHGFATLVEKALKHGPNYSIMKILELIGEHLQENRTADKESIQATLIYLTAVCHDAGARAHQVGHWCEQNINRETGVFYMTFAQKIQQEGWQKGLKEGEQKGRQEIVIRMLKQGIDMRMIERMTGIPLEQIQQIQQVVTVE